MKSQNDKKTPMNYKKLCQQTSHVHIEKAEEKMVSLSAYTPTQKQELWQWIKNNKPALATHLKSDNVKLLVKEFGGDVQVLWSDIKGAFKEDAISKASQTMISKKIINETTTHL